MFTSSYADVKIPDQDLVSFVLESDASLCLDKAIFVDADDLGRSYSHQSLRTTAKHFGAALANIGFKHGDVMAVFSANSIDFPMVVFGIFYASGIATLVNPVYRYTEVASQLIDSEAKAIYTTAELLPTALEACKTAGIPPSRIIVSSSSVLTHEVSLSTQVTSLVEFLGNNQDVQLPARQCRHHDLAFLCYSSGTTGLSKGVQLTHRNMISNLLQWDAAETFLTASDSVISVLPFSHIYALNVLVLNPLRRMMTSYVLPRFNMDKFFHLIESKSITASFVVPPIVKALLSPAAAKCDLSSLKFLCSGAAPLSPAMASDICTKYSLQISQGFGLTETSPVLCYARFDGSSYTGSVGQLLPSIELRVVNEDGIEQGYGGQGELQVRGPNVMRGYLKNDAANQIAFTEDGFFKTGDLGYITEDKCVYLVDRIKELIKYKGFQVPPVELENVLLTHPAVLDCAVIGRNCSEEVTELPAAYCVLRPSALHSIGDLPPGWTDLDAAKAAVDLELVLAKDIMNFVAAKVANYKKLRGGVVFTDSIPRVPAGKILRRVLRERTGVNFIL